MSDKVASAEVTASLKEAVKEPLAEEVAETAPVKTAPQPTERGAWLKLGLSLFGVAALLMGAVWWRWQNISAFGLSNDEGAYLMWARLVAAGYPLYSETAANQPPLFLEVLASVFRWLGFSVVAGRATVLLCFVALSGLLAYLSHKIAGWPAVWLTLLWAAVLTPLFSLSRHVLLEIPAMLLAVAAIACVWQAIEQPPSRSRWLWLAVSGLALAGSLLVKFLYVFTAVPLVYLIWTDTRSLGEWFKQSALAGVATVLGFWGTILLFFDGQSFVDQTINFRSSTWQAELIPRPDNLQILADYLAQNWGLALLAGAGFIFGLKNRRVWAWTIWLGLHVLLLLRYNPVFPHHFSLLLPPAFLLMAEFVAVLRHQLTERRSWLTAAGVGLILLTAFNLPSHVRGNQTQTAIVTGGREAEAARVLAEVTRPGDFVISDSQMLLHFAERLNPPPVVDFSLNYIQSGRHTLPSLVEMSQAYEVAAVAPWSLRLIWLPEYLDWVAANYWVEVVWDDQHRLFFGPKLHPQAETPNPVGAQFSSGITLAGYEVETAQPTADSPLLLTLYWAAEQAQSEDFSVFVQLLNASGQLVAQYDSQPLRGYLPTSSWPPGERIPDAISLPLPPDLPPGEYQLITGLYNWQTMERLTVLANGQDYLLLKQISVK